MARNLTIYDAQLSGTQYKLAEMLAQYTDATWKDQWVQEWNEPVKEPRNWCKPETHSNTREDDLKCAAKFHNEYFGEWFPEDPEPGREEGDMFYDDSEGCLKVWLNNEWEEVNEAYVVLMKQNFDWEKHRSDLLAKEVEQLKMENEQLKDKVFGLESQQNTPIEKKPLTEHQEWMSRRFVMERFLAMDDCDGREPTEEEQKERAYDKAMEEALKDAIREIEGEE